MFKRTSKYAYEMLVPKIRKNLTRRRSEFEKVVKGTDKALEGLAKESKVDVKSKGGIKKTVSKISKIIDDADKKGSGKKFPDLTGDGKVTFADILKGRGVINGKKKGNKNGKTMS